MGGERLSERTKRGDLFYPKEALTALHNFVSQLSHGHHKFKLQSKWSQDKYHRLTYCCYHGSEVAQKSSGGKGKKKPPLDQCRLRFRYKQGAYQLASKWGSRKHTLCSKARLQQSQQQLSTAHVPAVIQTLAPVVAPLPVVSPLQQGSPEVLPVESNVDAQGGLSVHLPFTPLTFDLAHLQHSLAAWELQRLFDASNDPPRYQFAPAQHIDVGGDKADLSAFDELCDHDVFGEAAAVLTMADDRDQVQLRQAAGFFFPSNDVLQIAPNQDTVSGSAARLLSEGAASYSFSSIQGVGESKERHISSRSQVHASVTSAEEAPLEDANVADPMWSMPAFEEVEASTAVQEHSLMEVNMAGDISPESAQAFKPFAFESVEEDFPLKIVASDEY